MVSLFAYFCSHSVGCFSFVFFMVSFAMQKLLGLIRSHLWIFFFHYSSSSVKTDISAIYVKESSAYIFLKEFYSIWLYVQVFNLFWVHFCSYPVSQQHLLKILSFFSICPWLNCPINLFDHRCIDLFLGYLCCSTDLHFWFCASTILFWWLWICSKIWS